MQWQQDKKNDVLYVSDRDKLTKNIDIGNGTVIRLDEFGNFAGLIITDYVKRLEKANRAKRNYVMPGETITMNKKMSELEPVPGSEQEYERVKEFIKKHNYIIPDDIHIKLGISGYKAVKYVEIFEKEGLLLRNEKEPSQASKVIHDLKLLNKDSEGQSNGVSIKD
jgi:uncharacterized protein YuzE